MNFGGHSLKHKKVESLFFGDKRLDNLYDVLLQEIYDRAGGQDIPIVSVLGILDKIKQTLLEEMK